MQIHALIFLIGIGPFPFFLQAQVADQPHVQNDRDHSLPCLTLSHDAMNPDCHLLAQIQIESPTAIKLIQKGVKFGLETMAEQIPSWGQFNPTDQKGKIVPDKRVIPPLLNNLDDCTPEKVKAMDYGTYLKTCYGLPKTWFMNPLEYQQHQSLPWYKRYAEKLVGRTPPAEINLSNVKISQIQFAEPFVVEISPEQKFSDAFKKTRRGGDITAFPAYHNLYKEYEITVPIEKLVVQLGITVDVLKNQSQAENPRIMDEKHAGVIIQSTKDRPQFIKLRVSIDPGGKVINIDKELSSMKLPLENIQFTHNGIVTHLPSQPQQEIPAEPFRYFAHHLNNFTGPAKGVSGLLGNGVLRAVKGMAMPKILESLGPTIEDFIKKTHDKNYLPSLSTNLPNLQEVVNNQHENEYFAKLNQDADDLLSNFKALTLIKLQKKDAKEMKKLFEDTKNLKAKELQAEELTFANRKKYFQKYEGLFAISEKLAVNPSFNKLASLDSEGVINLKHFSDLQKDFEFLKLQADSSKLDKTGLLNEENAARLQSLSKKMHQIQKRFMAVLNHDYALKKIKDHLESLEKKAKKIDPYLQTRTSVAETEKFLANLGPLFDLLMSEFKNLENPNEKMNLKSRLDSLVGDLHQKKSLLKKELKVTELPMDLHLVATILSKAKDPLTLGIFNGDFSLPKTLPSNCPPMRTAKWDEELKSQGSSFDGSVIISLASINDYLKKLHDIGHFNFCYSLKKIRKCYHKKINMNPAAEISFDNPPALGWDDKTGSLVLDLEQVGLQGKGLLKLADTLLPEQIKGKVYFKPQPCVEAPSTVCMDVLLDANLPLKKQGLVKDFFKKTLGVSALTSFVLKKGMEMAKGTMNIPEIPITPISEKMHISAVKGNSQIIKAYFKFGE